MAPQIIIVKRSYNVNKISNPIISPYFITKNRLFEIITKKKRRGTEGHSNI
jgi:hypothetical protein